MAVLLLNVDSVDLSAGTVNMDLLLYTRDESERPYFNDTLRLGNTYRLARIDSTPQYYRIQATFAFRPQTRDYPRDNQALRECSWRLLCLFIELCINVAMSHRGRGRVRTLRRDRTDLPRAGQCVVSARPRV